MTTRMIVLGASNLAMGFPFVVAWARQCFGSDICILAAHGHGRSYGRWSQFAGIRALPGIVECGLWQDLSGCAEAGRSLALITDVGNDLIYGEAPEAIARWVSLCVERVQVHRAQIILTGLPVDGLESLSPRYFYWARRLFFPTSTVSYGALLGRAQCLQELLHKLASETGIRLTEPQQAWYGKLPLHYRRRQRHQVWNAILGQWKPALLQQQRPPAVGPKAFVRIRTLQPQTMRLLSRTVRRSQPVYTANDGIRIGLY